jgi:hypothetical protein
VASFAVSLVRACGDASLVQRHGDDLDRCVREGRLEFRATTYTARQRDDRQFDIGGGRQRRRVRRRDRVRLELGVLLLQQDRY